MEASIQNTNNIERRSRIRYPVKLTVRYRTVGRKHHLNGTGQTLNMSSAGLLVWAEHGVSEGARMEVNIEWPLMLDGTVPLQLVAVGKVVRCAESVFAVSFAQYQFRTMGRMLKPTTDFDSDLPDEFDERVAGA